MKSKFEKYSLTGKDRDGNKIKTQHMGINYAHGMAKSVGLTGTIWFNGCEGKRYLEARYYDGDK